MKYEHFQEFIECYCEDDFSKRKETYSVENLQGRWRKYTIEEIIARDKTSLDISWLRQGEEVEDIPLVGDLVYCLLVVCFNFLYIHFQGFTTILYCYMLSNNH